MHSVSVSNPIHLRYKNLLRTFPEHSEAVAEKAKKWIEDILQI